MSTTDARRWHDWRDVITEDLANAPVLADLAADKLLEPRSEKFSVGVITVKGWEQIVVRFFGVGSNADDYLIYVFGWMSNGPGEMMYSGTVTLVNEEHASGYLLSAREDKDEAAYREGVIVNISGDDAYAATENAVATTLFTSNIIMNTGGYEHLQLFVRSLNGAGEASRARIIYRKSLLNQGR